MYMYTPPLSKRELRVQCESIFYTLLYITRTRFSQLSIVSKTGKQLTRLTVRDAFRAPGGVHAYTVYTPFLILVEPCCTA